MAHTHTLKRWRGSQAGGRGGGRGRGASREGGGRGRGVSKPTAPPAFTGAARTLAASVPTQGPQGHDSQRLAFVHRLQEDLDGLAALQHYEQQQERAQALAACRGSGGGGVGGGSSMCEPDPWQLRRAGTVTTMEQSCATSSRGTACREHYPSTDAPASDVIDLCSDSDDEHKVGRQAHGSAALPRASDPARQAPVGRSQGFTGGANPFLDPPRYIPPGGEDAPDLELRVREALYVLDVGLVRHRASAILDTGNAGHTLITRRMAGQLGLSQSLSTAMTVSVRGVVEGAAERVPLIPITYELKGARRFPSGWVCDVTKRTHLICCPGACRIAWRRLIGRVHLMKIARNEATRVSEIGWIRG